MENEEYIFVDGIQNIEKIKDENKMLKQIIQNLETEKRILQKKIESLAIQFSDIKLKYSQNKIFEKEDNHYSKRPLSNSVEFQNKPKRIKYE